MKKLIIIFGLLVCFMHAAAQNKIIRIEWNKKIRDYTPIVKAILDSHPEGNVCLNFSKGIFHFYPEKTKGQYLTVSNNDNGYKRIVFNIINMNNVSIQGENSTFLLHGKLVPFFFSKSSHISVKGIEIDYDFPFVFEGTVIANNTEEKSFTVKVHPDNPYHIKGNRFFFKGYDWELPLGENIIFNSETRSPIYNTSLYEHEYGAKELVAEEVDTQIVKFSQLAARDVPPVGSIYADKGPHGQNRQIPAFIIQNSSNVQLSNIIVYRSGAMALIAEKSRDIKLDSFNVCLRNGSDRMISVSADATHFVGCRGNISIKNCIFENMLDDATNVHAVYMKVDSILPNNTIGISFGHFQQEGYSFGEKRDSICLINRENLKTIAIGRIVKINQINENYYEIQTDIDLTPLKNVAMAIGNLNDNASVDIDKCSVKRNRARSLLISTAGTVRIENCYFASMMAGIRICGDANYWFESGPIREVTIRNNTFENLGVGGHSPQAILQIDPVIPVKERIDNYYHGMIRFENNTIRTFDSQVIYALGVKDLIIKGNVFVNSAIYKPLFPGLSVIDLQYCKRVCMQDNNFSQWSKSATISVKECDLQQKGKKIPLKITLNPNMFFYQE